jgi:hypothetical protein
MSKVHKTESDGSVVTEISLPPIMTPPVTTALAGVIGEEMDRLTDHHIGKDPTVQALGMISHAYLQTLDNFERRLQQLEDAAAKK